MNIQFLYEFQFALTVAHYKGRIPWFKSNPPLIYRTPSVLFIRLAGDSLSHFRPRLMILLRAAIRTSSLPLSTFIRAKRFARDFIRRHIFRLLWRTLMIGLIFTTKRDCKCTRAGSHFSAGRDPCAGARFMRAAPAVLCSYSRRIVFPCCIYKMAPFACETSIGDPWISISSVFFISLSLLPFARCRFEVTSWIFITSRGGENKKSITIYFVSSAIDMKVNDAVFLSFLNCNGVSIANFIL